MKKPTRRSRKQKFIGVIIKTTIVQQRGAMTIKTTTTYEKPGRKSFSAAKSSRVIALISAGVIVPSHESARRTPASPAGSSRVDRKTQVLPEAKPGLQGDLKTAQRKE